MSHDCDLIGDLMDAALQISPDQVTVAILDVVKNSEMPGAGAAVRG